MPRRAHLAVPAIPWPIIQRGNKRSVCFYADADDQRSLETLAEQAWRPFRANTSGQGLHESLIIPQKE